MARSYKCPFDGTVFYSISELESHVAKNYMDRIPKEYKGDYIHYLFDMRNPRGKCQVCGAPTKWDGNLKRYKNLCEPTIRNGIKEQPNGKGNNCRDIMRKTYEENMMKSYGRVNLMSDINYHNEKLLPNRKIAKKVRFKGKEFVVLGNLEKRFVEICDKLLQRSGDLQAPGPTIPYVKEGTVKEHIPDFYIKSINAIISIKDDGFGNENHPNVIKKRRDDATKFRAIINNKKKRFNHIWEFAGMQDIEELFPSLYERAKKERSSKTLLLPRYYKMYYPSDDDFFKSFDIINPK